MKTIADNILELGEQLTKELKEKEYVLMCIDTYNKSSEDDDIDVELHELPIYNSVESNYFQYRVYAILEIKLGGIIICGGLYEDSGEIIEANIDELELDNKCYLYNFIK